MKNADNKENSNKIIARIQHAVNAGITIRSLCNKSGVSFFRMASVVNVDSYRYMTTFTDTECEKLNKILDNIKKSL